ncbi:MAG: DUF819 family protein [Saprospiraceae bacterium]
MVNNLFVFTILCLLVVLCEWLVRKTWMKYLGTALLVILLTAVLANIGIIPAGSTPERPVVIYEGIFKYLAPISIFWLLLGVNLRDVLKAGGPIIALFLLGSLGTALGIIVGMIAINGPESIGTDYAALGGMFTGTYTGGSVNFNAVALHYDVYKDGVLYGTSIVVDNIFTTIWMILSILIPKLLLKFWPVGKTAIDPSAEPDLGIEQDTESMHPMDLGLMLAMGAGALWLSDTMAAWLTTLGINFPSIILITIFALIAAQLPIIKRLQGAQLLGMFAVYLFLAVIGAFCDVGALQGAGRLGLNMVGMITIALIVHATILFGAARLFKLDLQMAAVASQANVGGATSALALARSMGRSDLVLPAILIGSLGIAVGTFLGFWVAGLALPYWFG